MRWIGPDALEAALEFPSLIEALRRAFQKGVTLPPRHHYSIKAPLGPESDLLLMPAWQAGEAIGVKIVSVFSSNAQLELPAVSGVYVLLDGKTGQPLALMDGARLTLWRTAAASALAAHYLARPDARKFLMVGTGALAPYLIKAHATVRPMTEVTIWGRNHAKAKELAKRLVNQPYRVRAVENLEAATRIAEVISCATLSTTPLIQGAWLTPGTHLDLVGGFRPTMREADDTAIRRSRIFVDTLEGATTEAGDIVQPLQSRVLKKQDIIADLFVLARRDSLARLASEEITLFKSVGTAIEDLAAAQLVAKKLLQ
ncbi:MAG: ornithine cyclodeaminase family protein [Alphaproteobacteria bacterium]